MDPLSLTTSITPRSVHALVINSSEELEHLPFFGTATIPGTNSSLIPKTPVERLLQSPLTTLYTERKLEILKLKIEERKEKFKELVLSQDGTPEEKIDLERALHRMDNLLDLPSSELMLQAPGDIFDAYLGQVFQLLDLDPRSLNFILASTPVQNQDRIAQEAIKCEKDFDRLSDAEGMKLFLTLLPRWDIETNNYQIGNNDYFYLPGLPIVVKANGLPLLVQQIEGIGSIESVPVNDHDKASLHKMSEFIKASKWLETELGKRSLQITESIYVVHKGDFCGLRNFTGHPILKIDQTRTPFTLARTLLHEDEHYIRDEEFSKNPLFVHEQQTNIPPINHIWVSHIRDRKLLIEELFTHFTGNIFGYQALTEGVIEEEKDLRTFYGEMEENLIIARDAISRLEQEPNYLSEYGKEIIKRAKDLWDIIEKTKLEIKDKIS